MKRLGAIFFLFGLLACVPSVEGAADKVAFGRFGEIAIYAPTSVRHVALYFSDDRGWTATDDTFAKSLVARGYLVAGIDLRHYAGELAKPRDKCSYLAGEFEDMSHELQKRFSPQRYHLPVLVGVGHAAGLVYGVVAQGSSGTFAGVLTLRFNAHWQPLVRLCQSYGLRYVADRSGVALQPTERLSTPWIAIHSARETAFTARDLREFVTKVGTAKAVVIEDADIAFTHPAQWADQVLSGMDELAKPDRAPAIRADELSDLSLEEVRAHDATTPRMALFLTGDGGWAEIDKGVSIALARQGIDVVALSSLQYFWKPRSPEQTAQDVERILRHYLSAWNKREILIVGYSFGADVAPFVVNRLPQDLRERIANISLLGPSPTADFEVHVSTWLGVDHHGLPIKPEVARLAPRVLCVYGEGENDSLCPQLAPPRVTSLKIGDGHHFGDRHQELADAIVRHAR